MYDFKGKRTNISPLYPRTGLKRPSVISEDYESKDYQSKDYQSKDYQKIKYPSKIRFRHLSGTYTSDSQEAASSTSSIIWDGVGIGQTVFTYKTSISGTTVDLENTSIHKNFSNFLNKLVNVSLSNKMVQQLAPHPSIHKVVRLTFA